jgi:hypothetical protein
MATTDKVVFEFPTIVPDSRHTINLFDDDLGTGKSSGEQMPITASTDTTIRLNVEASVVAKIYQGDRSRYEPAKIELSGWTTGPTAGTASQIRIYGIKNPTTVADESVVPWLRCYIKDSTGKIKEERTIQYAFTVDKTVVATKTVTYPYPGNATNWIIKGAAKSFSFTSPSATNQAIGDFIYCKIPKVDANNEAAFDIKTAAAPAGGWTVEYAIDPSTVSSTKDWMLLKLGTAVNTGANVTMQSLDAPNWKVASIGLLDECFGTLSTGLLGGKSAATTWNLDANNAYETGGTAAA